MVTAIGDSLRRHGGRGAGAFLVGLVAVGGDLILVAREPAFIGSQVRAVLALLAIAALLLLAGDLPTVGLTPRPERGWGHWAKVALAAGAAVAVVLGVAFGVWTLLGNDLPLYVTPPEHVGAALLGMCVLAPVVEEALYRLVACAALVAVLGAWGAVLASGALFAGLHFAYGNPSPENQVGGFVLAWAFLRSGTVLVPVALHALGNLCVLAAQVAAWYWMS